MPRVNMDMAAPAIKKFLRSLSIGANGVEVELGGEVVCKIVPPGQLSDAEKSARLANVRRLLRQSQQRAKNVPGSMIERDIRAALKTVRGER